MTVNRFNGQRGTANSDSRSQQSTQKHMKWMHLSGNGDQSQVHFLFAVTLPSTQSKEKKLLQHCEYGCNIVSISWIKYQVSLSCHVRFNTGWMDLSQLRCVDSSVNGVLSHISHLCLHSLFEEVHSQTESSERLVQINKAKHFLFGIFVRASCFFLNLFYLAT